MKHTADDEEVKSLAALYALGALTQHEADAFREHLAEGCGACASELKEFEKVAAALAFASRPVAPPSDLREKLLASLNDDAAPVADAPAPAQMTQQSPSPEPAASGPDLLVIRAGEGEWMETPDEGVFAKQLFVDRERDIVTSLIRMTPGSRVPAHRHRGVEQCLVVEGDLRSGGVVLRAGDYNCAMTGTIHEELTTLQGNLLLIVAPESYEVLEQKGSTPPQS